MNICPEIASIVISIISLIISIIIAVKQYNMSRKSLESEYFNDIYKKHLIKNIPNARKYVRFDEGKLVDIQDMLSVLNDIRNDSLYYLYNDKEFYLKLKAACQGLEDFLVISSQRTLIGEEQTDILNELQHRLTDIYKITNNKFIGDK